MFAHKGFQFLGVDDVSSLLLRGSSGSHAIVRRECTTGVLTKRLKVKNGWALRVIFLFPLLSTPPPCQLLDGRSGGSEPDRRMRATPNIAKSV